MGDTALPGVPLRDRTGFDPSGDGYDWIGRLDQPSSRWQPVAAWGLRGWDLGSWPLVAVALFDDPVNNRFMVMQRTEGDLDIWERTSREERDGIVDLLAEWYWRVNHNGPDDLDQYPPGQLPPEYRGRFTWARLEEAKT